MAKPTLYTPEIAASILARLSDGEPLASICRDKGMPKVRTVSDWKKAHPSFSADFASARDEGYDALAAECLDIADTPIEGEETVTKADGGIEVRKGDMLGHRKLQIETRLKLLAKWDPRRYGDKVIHAGDQDAPVTIAVIERRIVRPNP
jgi:hypothetical protein